MAEIVSLRPSSLAMRLVFGFIAGFFATLTLHAAALAILHALGVTPAFPYGMKPTRPLGVPQEVSLAFWGGVWGVIFSAARPYPRNIAGYWLGAILFGAIAPTFVAWFIVFPLHGLPVAGGFHFPGLIVGPIVNGAWGFGTALFLGWMTGGVYSGRGNPSA
jgi:hypothetical protein